MHRVARMIGNDVGGTLARLHIRFSAMDVFAGHEFVDTDRAREPEYHL